MLNKLPNLPYTESFMVASCDKYNQYLYVTDIYGTISHVLVSITIKCVKKIRRLNDFICV